MRLEFVVKIVRSVKLSVVIFLYFSSFFAWALGNVSVRPSPESQKIELITGLDKPPFVMNQAKTGLQLDMIMQAFALKDVEVNFVSLPLGRNFKAYLRWNIDSIITLPADYSYPGIYLSQPYITYQNVAVSLVEKNFFFDNYADLFGKSVVAFQTASILLGEEFKYVIKYSTNYREMADQNKQITQLFLDKTEVIVLDINIFKYFIKLHQTEKMYRKPYKIHTIFKEMKYSAGFKSEKIRNIFDLGIEEFMKNGGYERLSDKYLINRVHSRSEKDNH